MTKLDELEALLQRATPGPWEQHDHGGTICAITDTEQHLCMPLAEFGGRPNDIHDANAIAAIRNLAPTLIAVARAAAEMVGPGELTLDRIMRVHAALTALEES